MAAMPTGVEHAAAANGLIPLEALAGGVEASYRSTSPRRSRVVWLASLLMVIGAVALTMDAPTRRPARTEAPRMAEGRPQNPAKSSRPSRIAKPRSGGQQPSRRERPKRARPT